MPCIAHTTTFKAASDHFALLLTAKHTLRSSEPQGDEIQGNAVSGIILARNPLLFTLSGSKDGILATHHELVVSKTTNCLLEYLRKVHSQQRVSFHAI